MYNDVMHFPDDAAIVTICMSFAAAAAAAAGDTVQQKQQLFRDAEKHQLPCCDNSTAYADTDTSADVHLVLSIYFDVLMATVLCVHFYLR